MEGLFFNINGGYVVYIFTWFEERPLLTLLDTLRALFAAIGTAC